MRGSKNRLYKSKYVIVFYDKTDTDLLYIFDNVAEILEFQGKPLTDLNRRLVNVELCRALKTDTHFIKFLTGAVMRVYIIDVTEDENK